MKKLFLLLILTVSVGVSAQTDCFTYNYVEHVKLNEIIKVGGEICFIDTEYISLRHKGRDNYNFVIDEIYEDEIGGEDFYIFKSIDTFGNTSYISIPLETLNGIYIYSPDSGALLWFSK